MRHHPFFGVDSVTARHDLNATDAVLIYEADLYRHHDYLRFQARQAQTRIAEVDTYIRRRQQHSQPEIPTRGMTQTVLARLYLRHFHHQRQAAVATAVRSRTDYQHRLQNLQQRQRLLAVEQDRVDAWLNHRIDPQTPAGLDRAQLAEAAERSSAAPAWVCLTQLDHYAASHPERVLRRTPAGAPVLDGIDFGLHWRHEPTDDYTNPRRPSGRWRLSFIPGVDELYALPTGPEPDRQLWSFGPIGLSEDHIETILQPLMPRMSEPNSLRLVADVVNKYRPSSSRQSPRGAFGDDVRDG